MAKPEAILTDFDGTFADSVRANTVYHQDVFRELLGKELTDEFIADRLHLSVRAFIAEMIPTTTEQETDDALARAFAVPYRYDLIELMPGAETFFRGLDEEMPVAIVSSGRANHIRTTLTGQGVDDLFPEVVGFGDYTNAKPHPEPILTAAERLGVNPERTVYIGDHDVDIQAAKAAGARGILLSETDRSEDGFDIIQSWDDLPALLEERA